MELIIILVIFIIYKLVERLMKLDIWRKDTEYGREWYECGFSRIEIGNKLEEVIVERVYMYSLFILFEIEIILLIIISIEEGIMIGIGYVILIWIGLEYELEYELGNL